MRYSSLNITGDDATSAMRWRADLGGFVCAKVYDDVQRLVHTPLTNLFAFAVPADEAIAVLAAHAPLLEPGAGTGYWYISKLSNPRCLLTPHLRIFHLCHAFLTHPEIANCKRSAT
jgi:hypothetical protein